MDGFVCFYNSHLISGRLGKVTLGGGNKSGLFQVRGLRKRQSMSKAVLAIRDTAGSWLTCALAAAPDSHKILCALLPVRRCSIPTTPLVWRQSA